MENPEVRNSFVTSRWGAPLTPFLDRMSKLWHKRAVAALSNDRKLRRPVRCSEAPCSPGLGSSGFVAFHDWAFGNQGHRLKETFP